MHSTAGRRRDRSHERDRRIFPIIAAAGHTSSDAGAAHSGDQAELLMTRDILFLLNPRFVSETGTRQFCPETMMIEGVLSCFPDLRARLDVRYVDFSKPRKPIVELLGEARQGVPMLVRRTGGGMVTVDQLNEILRVFWREYGTSEPRGLL
jgi:hypothetical protein